MQRRWSALISIAVWLAPFPLFTRADEPQAFPLTIRPTALLRGSADAPSAVVELRLERPLAAMALVSVRAPEGLELFSETRRESAAGDVIRARVPLPGDMPRRTVVVRVTEGDRTMDLEHVVERPDAGWTLHFIPGFHYDPVWWNTQAHYTETGYRLGSEVGPGLTLVSEYLRKIREEGDYRVALHQLPYLKSFVEARPTEVGELLERIHDGHVSLVGGTYNELSSTLVSAEAIARNAIYGSIFQRETLGGDGRIFWQCDVFGHDPSFPSIMRRCGHEAGAFARGPFHQWGAGREQVNFPSEFLWMAPDGEAILTHYMTGHYGYAYNPLATAGNRASDDPARWEPAIIGMFEDLKRPALTHHVMLPMHADFIRPLENLGDVVRWWNATYVSPKAVISTPEAFFAAVRAEIADRGLFVPTITRDMNPIYTGCQVSFADLKTASRECEARLFEAEAFATIAALEGAPYPTLGIDRAWRQLLFASHHDGVTGSMSDQVYVDILYSYRDALDIATRVRDGALDYLTSRVPSAEHDGRGEVAWNSLAFPQSELIDDLRMGISERQWIQVPGIGYSSKVRSTGLHSPWPDTDREKQELQNDDLTAIVDLEKGGTLVSLFDKRANRDLLRGSSNDVVVLGEYSSLPGQGEGPWHIATTGERVVGTSTAARAAERSGINNPRLVIEADYPLFTKRQTYELIGRRLDVTTEIIDWKGSDKLLRVEFPFDLPGALPVYATAAGVIGRPFARDGDAAKEPWSLDQACTQWVDLGSTCVVEVVDGDKIIHRRALGVGEIVVDRGGPKELLASANRLAEAFVKCGVTTTVVMADQRRYGDIAYDTNVPDFRVGIGSPVTMAIALGIGDVAPRADLRLLEREGKLPILLLPDADAVAGLAEQLDRDQRIRLPIDATTIDKPQVLADYGVALIPRDSVSVHVTEDGTMGLNLLRSSTGWPSGVWIDKPARRLPDGAAFETMHGSHVFRYSLVPHEGDFRKAELSRIAQELNHPLIVTERKPGVAPTKPEDALPASMSFLSIDNPKVLLTALKPEGFPEARWSTSANSPPTSPTTIVARLWNGAGKAVETDLHIEQLSGRAWRSNLLEERLEELPVRNKFVHVKLAPNAYETILCEVQPRTPRAMAPAYDPIGADASPSEYWLEDRGEGATGNGLITVVPQRRTLTLENGKALTPLRIVNHHRSEDAIVQVFAEASQNLHVFLGCKPFEIDLSKHPLCIPGDRLKIPPGGQAELVLSVDAFVPEAFVGPHRRSVVTIGVRSQFPWSTCGSVWIEPPGPPDPLPPIYMSNDAAIVRGDDALRVHITNRTDGPISGEAAFLAPQSAWSSMGEWRGRVTIPPQKSVVVECPLHGALDSWAMLRFTFAGRIAYGDPIAITNRPEKVLLTLADDRLRVRQDQTAELTAELRSLSGLAEDSPVTVDCPQGWSAKEISRRLVMDSGVQRLTAKLTVSTGREPAQAELTVRGPHEASAHVSAVVVPVQVARASAAGVTIDGILSEWDTSEFTRAKSALGVVRAAVRYSADRLVLAAEVEDELFAQRFSGAAMWQGDSLQFGLSAKPSTAKGFQESDCEFGVARTPDGPQIWCWIEATGGRTGLVEGAKVAVVTDAGRTRYEVSLPSAAIPAIALAPGSVLGFSYIANDNDGDGFRGAIQWTGGLSGAKEPSLFGELELQKE